MLNVIAQRHRWSAREFLDPPITKKEIEAIMSMKLNKAPGPDGYTIDCYKNFNMDMPNTGKTFWLFHKGYMYSWILEIGQNNGKILKLIGNIST